MDLAEKIREYTASLRLVSRDGYTKCHAGATCETCGTKVNQDNVEKVRYQSVERRGFNKGRVNTQITGNYSRCRQCAAAAG
jgi:ferredoxin